MGKEHRLFSCSISPIEDAWSKWFSDKNIWRMKQFYETYRDNPKLSPLVAEIPWTNNLLIMTACKTDEAKEFYIRTCIENRY